MHSFAKPFFLLSFLLDNDFKQATKFKISVNKCSVQMPLYSRFWLIILWWRRNVQHKTKLDKKKIRAQKKRERERETKMDVNAANPYEQKLYNMFKSFDTQSLGTLDKKALMDLCETLELKDRSAKLVTNLIDPKRNNRVTFNEFKEGLLNLLGTTDTDDNDNSITNGKHITITSNFFLILKPNFFFLISNSNQLQCAIRW